MLCHLLWVRLFFLEKKLNFIKVYTRFKKNKKSCSEIFFFVCLFLLAFFFFLSKLCIGGSCIIVMVLGSLSQALALLELFKLVL